MIQVTFHSPEEIEDQKLQYVVTGARYADHWIFSRHKQRSTWELPGGRREPGETVLQAMRRELWEETGATDAAVTPVCVYSVTQNAVTTYGMLFYSEIHALEALPAAYEIGEIQYADTLPEELTYPVIQPELFLYLQGWMNRQSNAGEMWDIYDGSRRKTGQLHRRGDPLKAGQYHLAVHVWILNHRGEFLLTKRSSRKGFPNMWESTGGSALAGDDSLTAALREVREETGLTLNPALGCCVLSSRKEDYFRDVWLFRQSFDLEEVILQPEETTDKMYAGREVIRQLFREGSFVPYDYLEDLFAKTFGNTDADI